MLMIKMMMMKMMRMVILMKMITVVNTKQHIGNQFERLQKAESETESRSRGLLQTSTKSKIHVDCDHVMSMEFMYSVVLKY